MSSPSSFARTCAAMVLPVPGGPYKTTETPRPYGSFLPKPKSSLTVFLYSTRSHTLRRDFSAFASTLRSSQVKGLIRRFAVSLNCTAQIRRICSSRPSFVSLYEPSETSAERIAFVSASLIRPGFMAYLETSSFKSRSSG